MTHEGGKSGENMAVGATSVALRLCIIGRIGWRLPCEKETPARVGFEPTEPQISHQRGSLLAEIKKSSVWQHLRVEIRRTPLKLGPLTLSLHPLLNYQETRSMPLFGPLHEEWPSVTLTPESAHRIQTTLKSGQNYDSTPTEQDGGKKKK